jgi:predicted esterase
MVTGYLVTPAGPGPFAGIVFGHWGPGDRTEFLPEASLYAHAGAVSVMIDNPWNRPAPWRKPQGQGLGEPEKDRDSWVNAVVDMRRAIDVLASRPGVDAGRIGYVGHSYGAQWGAILSAVDDRVRAAALMGGVPDTDAILVESNEPDIAGLRARHSRAELDRYLEMNRPLDGIRYVPHAKPTPLLFQFARHERYLGEAAMKRYAEAASEPKEVRWYDTGHDLNDVRALADRADWIGRRLGMKPVGPILRERLTRSAESRPAAEPIRVYLGATDARGGGLRADVRDSVSDLSKALAKREAIRLVGSQDEADAEIWVVDRYRARTGHGVVIPNAAASVIVLPIRERVVVASLVSNDRRLEVLGTHRRTWRGAASDLAERIEGSVRYSLYSRP